MPGDDEWGGNSSRASTLPYPLLLCPGSSFVGYQAGLRSSWTVRVTILDVDMQQLTCCGRMDAVDTPGVDSELVATYFEGHFIDHLTHTFGTQPPPDSPHTSSHHSTAEQRQWKSVHPYMQHVYPTLKAAHAQSTHSHSRSHSHTQCDGGTDTDTHHHTAPSLSTHCPLPPLLSPPAAVGGAAASSPVTRLLQTSRYLFVRWKERYFLCGADGRLSISGVYLLAFDRLTGEISGVYWDEQAQARRTGKKRCQELRLQRVPDATRDGRISTHSLH